MIKKRVIRCAGGILEIRTPRHVVIFNVSVPPCNGGPVTILNVMERRPYKKELTPAK